jgi:hypothetical protein
MTPVEDSVTKVNDEIAVGSDLEFQHRWWRFERVIWTLFGLLILADLLGFFGRGHFAKTRRSTTDGTMDVKYERIERAATPSILIVQFGPSAIHEGKVRLWASETMVKELGAQRVIPEPSASAIGDGGISYTFSAGRAPASVQFALQPLALGIHSLSLRVPGSEQMTMKILVMP